MGDDSYLYDLLHRGTPGDVEHYVRACRGASRVLELGCGDGRVLAALASVGHSVTGIDLDGDRLESARRRTTGLPGEVSARIRLVRGDMRTFDLGERFGRVLIPYNGLYCLLADDDVRSCLRRVRAHLEPAGELLFDGYRVDPDPAATPVEENGPFEFLTAIQDGTRRIRVFERDRWDVRRQRIDATYVFHIDDDSGAHVTSHTIPHRYLERHQVESFLREAGFTRIAIAGNFRHRPLREDSLHFVVTASVAQTR